ncbi:MAG: cyclodeaminase/cyclohydrolase family protein [Anaeromicrobium sp.]|jgi:formiminotetrahydrofolate cyclodeaminase|uniref:cyclodeaminase/cyclohydrolase family protein n=1 Tax=Anaeromicrobium sp. TaxID=1929132 RepID=UPI0025E20C07|nr:cyclodeaminase/cyclohydrolase family protein [Anaeromicrobium sp.]MCT4595005.1 cyclodeaminase/cyclohydrolase family protein [Anaeromicrobium sp.]
MLVDLNVKEFLNKTASKEPVPGGGSIAALSAGIGAALTEMVANLTIGKKKYVEVEEEMKEIAEKAEEFRNEFVLDIDRDSDAFNEVMDAFKLPKETDEDKAKRKEAIQAGSKSASLVPLSVAKKALEIMEIIEVVVVKGNQNAVTDGAVAAMMSRTAVLSALYNVKINLGSIKDETFVEEVSAQVKEIESKVEEVEKRILGKVVL